MGAVTGPLEPTESLMVPRSALEGLGAAPGGDDLLQRVLAPRAGKLALARAEARLEAAQGAAQDGLGLEAEPSGQERGRQEHVPELVLDACALLGRGHGLRVAREAARLQLRVQHGLLLCE